MSKRKRKEGMPRQGRNRREAKKQKGMHTGPNYVLFCPNYDMNDALSGDKPRTLVVKTVILSSLGRKDKG